MLHSVFAKTLNDQRRGLLSWFVAITLIVLMYAAIWPSVASQPSLSDFLDKMPEAFRNLFATTGADMSTPVGYIQIELMSFMGPALLIAYAVGQGSAAIAGEEDHHTIDLLLGAPLSRGRVVVEKAGALVLGTAFLATVTGIALVVEGRLFDMDLAIGAVTAAMLHLALLGLVFGGLALALGAATGHLGLARGVPAAAAVVAYLINGLGGMVHWLEPFQRFSPFYQFAAHDPLRHGVSYPSAAVAVGTFLVLVALAVWGFQRRDVRG
jgi:ABC-2 type transport system permease protein